jgi:hypothetical protein
MFSSKLRHEFTCWVATAKVHSEDDPRSWEGTSRTPAYGHHFSRSLKSGHSEQQREELQMDTAIQASPSAQLLCQCVCSALPHSCQALFSIFYQVLPTVLLRVQSSIIHYQVGEFTSVCLGIYLHIFKSGIYGGQNINHTPSPIKLLQILKVKVTAKKWDLFPSCHFFQSVNS